MLTRTSFHSPRLPCYYLEQPTKTSLFLGHTSFIPLPLRSPCMNPCSPLRGRLSPPRHPGVCLISLSGCLKSLLRITLCPWRRSPHCFLTRHALALPLTSPHLTSSHLISPRSAPPHVYPSLSLSVSFSVCFSLLRVLLHRKHFASSGELKSRSLTVTHKWARTLPAV